MLRCIDAAVSRRYRFSRRTKSPPFNRLEWRSPFLDISWNMARNMARNMAMMDGLAPRHTSSTAMPLAMKSFGANCACVSSPQKVETTAGLPLDWSVLRI